MSIFIPTNGKLSPERVREILKNIDEEYREALSRAEKEKEVSLTALRKACPHKNHDSGEGGSLDYWWECKDCGET